MIKTYEDIIKENETQIRKNKNNIKIIYKNDENKEDIGIFGYDFVQNNKNKCKILYNNEVYELQDRFKSKNINPLEIQLIGILNITDMTEMFRGCDVISLPDIHLIDTSNISSMCDMFKGCSCLVSLPDISNWNTSNVTDMMYMFGYCYSLISLPDISKWNVNKVTTMSLMFYGCSSLISLPDLSKWNINFDKSNSMFGDCPLLKFNNKK